MTPRPADPFLGVTHNSPPIEFDTTATTTELLESAREMFLTDNYVLSEMLYKAVLIRDPNHLSAMLELAVVYETMGRLQYARGLLTRASILKPYDQQIIDRNNEIAKRLSRSLEAEIDSLLSAGAFETAMPKLSVLLTTQPENAELYYKRAVCLLGLENPDDALSEIDKAVRLRQDNRYFELRTKALALKRDREIGVLGDEISRLVATGRAEDRDRALELVSRILERDPEHGWAKNQFLVLTGGQDETEHLRGADIRWSEIWTSVKAGAHHAAGMAVSVGNTLNDHLEILLLALIVLVIFGSPLTLLIMQGFNPRQALSGRLNQFDIHEVLAMIHSQNRTGVLKIDTGSVKGRVYFDNGEIYHCTGGGLEGRAAVRHVIENATTGHFVFSGSFRSFHRSRTVDAPLTLILMDLFDRMQKNAGGSRSDTESSVSQPPKSRMKTLLENKT